MQQEHEGEARPAVSRRTFLRRGGRAGAALLGTGTAASVLAACGSSSGTTSTAATRQPRGVPASAKYGRDSQLIVHSPANLYFQQWELGYRMACEAFGLVPHVGYSNDEDSGELSVLSTALIRGARYVSTVGPSDQVIATVAKMCAAHEAWLCDAFASPAWTMVQTYGDYYRAYNQSPDYLLAYEMGKRVFRAIGGKGQVAHIKGIPGQGISYLRAAGYRQAASEFPDIDIVAENWGYFNASVTEPIFSAMFTAHPDIKAVVNASDDSNLGCIAVLRDREVKGVLMTSIDAIPQYLEEMEKGEYAYCSGSILGTWMGAWLVAQAYDAAHGVPISPLERQVTFGSIILEGPAAAREYSRLVLDPASAQRIYDPQKMSRHLHPHDWEPQNSLAVMNPYDRTGSWVPESLPSVGYAHMPAGWQPPASWTKAAANGGIAAHDAMLARAAARNDPLAPIRHVVGTTIL